MSLIVLKTNNWFSWWDTLERKPIYAVLLPQVYNLHQIMRKQLEKPKLRGILSNIWPVGFKKCWSWKTKAEELFQIKRDMTAKCNMWSWIGSWIGAWGEEGLKGDIRHINQNLNKDYILDNETALVINILNLITVLWLYERMSLLRRYMLTYLGVKAHSVCSLLSHSSTK